MTVRRREHAHVACLTHAAPSETTARDVAEALKADVDPETVDFGPVVLRHTRYAVTVLSDDRVHLENLKTAVE